MANSPSHSQSFRDRKALTDSAAPNDEWQNYLEATTLSHAGEGAAELAESVPGLTILAHPNPGRIGARVALPALVSDRTVELSRRSPEFAQPDGSERQPLADPHLSRKPIRLEPGETLNTVRLLRDVDGASLLADGEPIPAVQTFSTEDLRRGVVLLMARRVALLLHHLSPIPQDPPPRYGLVGASTAITQLRREIRQVGPLSVTVLLRGETGTGKELVARAIHQDSPRGRRPYIAVNMSAIPPSLAASELFGAAKGAFTGADRRRMGYFQQAAGGTLFLDEIGDAATDVQTLLLRVLETGEVQPVGAEKPQKLDVRVIAATDSDLETAIAEGRFRSPLLHRLSGYEVHVPPLRERRDDIGRLLVHFLRQELEALGAGDRLDDPGPRGRPWLSAELVARLASYDWPGNVRQLRNVARQLAVRDHGAAEATLSPRLQRLLEPAKMPRRETSKEGAEIASSPTPGKPKRRYRRASEIDDQELMATLRDHRWRLQPTAAALGISRTSLYTLIDRCSQIRKPSQLDGAEIEACLERVGGNVDAAVEELQVSRHGLLLRMRELGIPPSGTIAG